LTAADEYKVAEDSLTERGSVGFARALQESLDDLGDNFATDKSHSSFSEPILRKRRYKCNNMPLNDTLNKGEGIS
jgi:hypothetical protein